MMVTIRYHSLLFIRDCDGRLTGRQPIMQIIAQGCCASNWNGGCGALPLKYTRKPRNDMTIQRYSVNQYSVQNLLTWIETGSIAIPEIQRPFVWNTAKVRDFIDSLYCGYPVGYLIAWRNPDVRMKDGSTSEGKRILIDGQQRVTALRAAVQGQQVVDKNYRTKRITIAFNPDQKKFEVSNPAIHRGCGSDLWDTL